ncbi:unnamed protein product [Moneuplotes crassus]|uniref:Glutathione S-transferase n=1 Tax=Euplotes crassus TaxID=5936 RepID=A0AAD1XW68_EUPCR|nr:unnamed protein product [Moneuplotes crassus]
MPLTFWYNCLSDPSRSVYYVIKKLGIEHELNIVEIGKETRTEEFKKDVNPAGTVPVIKHDDDFIYESANIIRYLLDSFDPEDILLPRTNLKERAKVGYWLDWRNTTYRPPSQLAIDEITVEPLLFGAEKPSDEECKKMVGKVYDNLKVIEAAVTDKSYLTGENLTIADVYLYNEVLEGQKFIELEVKGKTKEWFERVEEDETVKEITDSFLEALSKF